LPEFLCSDHEARSGKNGESILSCDASGCQGGNKRFRTFQPFQRFQLFQPFKAFNPDRPLLAELFTALNALNRLNGLTPLRQKASRREIGRLATLFSHE